MAQNPQNSEFAEDYKKIKSDIRKVIISNVIFIALLIVLYFVNRKIGFITSLEKFF